MRSGCGVSRAHWILLIAHTVVASSLHGGRLCTILHFPDYDRLVVATRHKSSFIVESAESRGEDQSVVRFEACDRFVVFVEFLSGVSRSQNVMLCNAHLHIT